MHCEAGAHICCSANSMGRQPGLPGARYIGCIVVEMEDLVRRKLQTGSQAAEGLRVRLAPAKLGREDHTRAEEVGDGGKHLGNVPLQQQRVVGEHPDRAIHAELSRQREHGQVWLDRYPPGLHPLGGAEGIAQALAESPQVVVRRHDPTLRLVLEPRAPDGGVDRIRSLPAPRGEPGQPALDPVATEHAVHIEDDYLDHRHSLPGVRVTDGCRPAAKRLTL